MCIYIYIHILIYFENQKMKTLETKACCFVRADVYTAETTSSIVSAMHSQTSVNIFKTTSGAYAQL